jgi:prolyl-tRNA synthetase
MRFTNFFIPTTKEVPKDTVIKSHEYLIRGGYISQVSAGIYNFLPLGHKVLNKIKKIVQDELTKAGALEVTLGLVTPHELWVESGRASKYGKELLRFKDRKNKEYLLGPTHEETIVNLVRGKIKSYKNLPINLYQINTKFRDEARARFGLIRGREFVMKDGYSFHESKEDLDREFNLMEQTYSNIFKKLEIDFRVVEADSGAIGGSGSKEFMALSDIGEDTIVVCDSCEYGANIETSSRARREILEKSTSSFSLFYTPNTFSISSVSDFLKVHPSNILKAVVKKAIFKNKEELVCFFLRGDDELQEIKAINSIGADDIIDASEEELKEANLKAGFIGPIILKDSKFSNGDKNTIGDMKFKSINKLEIKHIFDIDLKDREDEVFMCGANIKDFHIVGLSLDKIKNKIYKNLAVSKELDKCKCGGSYLHKKGIEIGHIFKLNDKYSSPMKAKFLDKNGKEQPFIMGTYGIGVSRLIGAISEQKSDEKGLIWGNTSSPFDICIIISDIKNEKILNKANEIYNQLIDDGFDVLIDDRKERFGFKMKDFELIGCPLGIIIGKDLENGEVSLVDRISLKKISIKTNDIFSEIKKINKNSI